MPLDDDFQQIGADTSVTPHKAGAARIMISNGGPHPASAWAQVTAQHIAPVAADMAGDRYVAAMKLQLAITEALQPHHETVQSAERGKLAADPAHLLTDLDPSQHADAALAAVVACAKGTPWEAHFAKADVQAVIRHELGVHFASAQHIERSWHVDRTPNHPHADAWRAMVHPGGEA